jgi:hypothetical protein
MSAASPFFAGLLELTDETESVVIHISEGGVRCAATADGLLCAMPASDAFHLLVPYLHDSSFVEAIVPDDIESVVCNGLLPKAVSNMLFLGLRQHVVDHFTKRCIMPNWPGVVTNDAFSAHYLPFSYLTQLVYMLRKEHASLAIVHAWASRGGWGEDQRPALVDLIFQTGELAVVDDALLHQVRTKTYREDSLRGRYSVDRC